MFGCGFSALSRLDIIMIIALRHYFTSLVLPSEAVLARMLLSLLPSLLFPTVWSAVVCLQCLFLFRFVVVFFKKMSSSSGSVCRTMLVMWVCGLIGWTGGRLVSVWLTDNSLKKSAHVKKMIWVNIIPPKWSNYLLLSVHCYIKSVRPKSQ